MMKRLFPSSFIIALVAFMNNWAVGVKYASKNKYDIEPNRELVASGYVNFTLRLNCHNLTRIFSIGINSV